MNILWICNLTFPEAQNMLTGKGDLRASGGWMIGAAEMLVKQNGVKLTVASLSKLVKNLTFLKGDKINYYILPYGKGNNRVNHEYDYLWKEVKEKTNPDVIHIHGTEYTHGLSFVESCGTNNVCVSIQGLVSAYYHYYYGGLTSMEIFKAITPASFIRGGILSGYRDFKNRGKSEIDLIKRVHHIIGRTSWDRDRTWAINPDAVYHYGGETLRPEFYSGKKWKFDQCTPQSIFLSQSWIPIKGLHQVLRAMPYVLRHYPDTTIRVAGGDLTRRNGWVDRLKLSDYGNIVRYYIGKYNLQDKITFTGRLNANEMVNEYLHCNVFICPSSIENSPNSLAEAQVLGVPTLASYVGGIMDMMSGDEEHLYRFEEIEMLAHKIVELFEQKDKICTNHMREVALKRHDPVSNVRELMDIYKKIILEN